jgi:hypothetical protein
MPEEDLFNDVNGDQIAIGDLVTPPANLDADGKPLAFGGMMLCVGRNEDENNVFVRYMGKEMVHSFHPAKLQIVAPKKHRDITRHRSGASLAVAA